MAGLIRTARCVRLSQFYPTSWLYLKLGLSSAYCLKEPVACSLENYSSEWATWLNETSVPSSPVWLERASLGLKRDRRCCWFCSTEKLGSLWLYLQE